jgi:acyl-CoA synthetase (NDP forming)
MIASAGPAEYASVIATILDAPDVDALIVLHTPVDTTSEKPVVEAIAGAVAGARRRGTAKPVVACLLSGGDHPAPISVDSATGERLPAYRFPENAARALAHAARFADWHRRDAGALYDFDDLDLEGARTICRTALEHSIDAWLDAQAVHCLLGAFGLPTLQQRVASSADEAAAAASALGFPVAAKLSSTVIQHKSEVGGVRLGLADESAVREAFAEIVRGARAAAPDDRSIAVLIQPMAAAGVETIMGITHDPHFGALVAFGLGGVDVEILGDVQFRIAPLTDQDVDEMLDGIRGARLLAGYRGRPAADRAALRDTLLRLSRLAEELPEIVELDLNPVVALRAGSGCQIVDARIRVARRDAT